MTALTRARTLCWPPSEAAEDLSRSEMHVALWAAPKPPATPNHILFLRQTLGTPYKYKQA